jgi:hypothetical protein
MSTIRGLTFEDFGVSTATSAGSSGKSGLTSFFYGGNEKGFSTTI